MLTWEDVVTFHRDCDKWEKTLKGACTTKEEKQVISDCFTRMRDQFSMYFRTTDNECNNL